MRETDLELNSNITNVDKQNTPAPDYRLLAKLWLDDFEKQNFNGKTLDELLNGRDRV